MQKLLALLPHHSITCVINKLDPPSFNMGPPLNNMSYLAGIVSVVNPGGLGGVFILLVRLKIPTDLPFRGH